MFLPRTTLGKVGLATTLVNTFAIIKKDRSLLLVVVGLPVALFLILFIGGELLFPH